MNYIHVLYITTSSELFANFTGASTGLPVVPSGDSLSAVPVYYWKTRAHLQRVGLKVLHIPIGLEVHAVLSTELRILLARHIYSG